MLPHTVVASKGSDSTKDKPSAIAVFGGLVTKNNWEDALAPWNLNYRESFLAGPRHALLAENLGKPSL